MLDSPHRWQLIRRAISAAVVVSCAAWACWAGDRGEPVALRRLPPVAVPVAFPASDQELGPAASAAVGRSETAAPDAAAASLQRLPEVSLNPELRATYRTVQHASQAQPVPHRVPRNTIPSAEPPGDGAHTGASVPGGPLAHPTQLNWWSPSLVKPLRSGPSLEVTLEGLIIDALRFSPRVRHLGDAVLIKQTSVLESVAQFDPRMFMDTKLIRTSDPVGNTLTTGGPPRLREENWTYAVGLRKPNQLGGTFEVAQQFGLQDSNSLFFLPPNQGNSRLSLRFSQPLLNGAGRAVNNSVTVLADLDVEMAWNQLAMDLQDHLIDVSRSYWQLHLQRALFVQKQQHLARAQQILAGIEARRSLDALESQVLRSRAAVALRQAEVVRTAAEVRNAESRIRALVNAPELRQQRFVELVPIEVPADSPFPVEMQDALITALQNRPEVDEATKKIRASLVKRQVSENQLLPALNLVLETYVAGLEGNRGIGDAFAEQFTEGEPGYTAGLMFEVPLYRRAAAARLQRSQLEMRRLTGQFDELLENLAVEVEVAVREVDTSYREMLAKRQSTAAAREQVEYLEQRWQLLAGQDRSASFVLEELLDAQDRLSSAEGSLAAAQVAYAISLLRLKEVTGTLLQQQRVRPQTVAEDGLPRVEFQAEHPGHGQFPSPDESP